MAMHAVYVEVTKTANGGDEWNLRCADKRVPMPGRVGIFTDPENEPADMLPRLLSKATAFAASKEGY